MIKKGDITGQCFQAVESEDRSMRSNKEKFASKLIDIAYTTFVDED